MKRLNYALLITFLFFVGSVLFGNTSNKKLFTSNFYFINESTYKINDIKAYATNKKMNEIPELKQLTQDFFSISEQCTVTIDKNLDSKEVTGSVKYPKSSTLVYFFIEVEKDGKKGINLLYGKVIHDRSTNSLEQDNGKILPYIASNKFVLFEDGDATRVDTSDNYTAFLNRVVFTENTWRLEVHNKTPDTFDIIFSDNSNDVFTVNGFDNVYVENTYNLKENKNKPISFTIHHNGITFFLSAKVSYISQRIPLVIEGFGNDGKIYYTMGEY